MLQAKFRKTWVILWTRARWPVEEAVTRGDGKVIDAGDAAAHEAVFVQLPVLIAVGAEP